MRSPPMATTFWKLTTCRLTQNEQRELQNRMEKKQMKEFMNVCAVQAGCMPSRVDACTGTNPH